MDQEATSNSLSSFLFIRKALFLPVSGAATLREVLCLLAGTPTFK